MVKKKSWVDVDLSWRDLLFVERSSEAREVSVLQNRSLLQLGVLESGNSHLASLHLRFLAGMQIHSSAS